MIVLLFHCVSFVETKKISTFVTPSASMWEESPCPPSPKEVVLLLKNALSQESGLILLDLSQVWLYYHSLESKLENSWLTGSETSSRMLPISIKM